MAERFREYPKLRELMRLKVCPQSFEPVELKRNPAIQASITGGDLF